VSQTGVNVISPRNDRTETAMPKGYWIPHLDVSNPDEFQAYRSKADAWHQHNGSTLLARAGRLELVEGKIRSRNVLRQFGSFDEALAGYRSPEYSAARTLRAPHAQCDFLIVEGYEDPQPERVGTPPAAAARKGYWIAHVDVTDPEGYKAYQAANGAPIGQFGGHFLVRGGRHEVVEGKQRARTAVLEFPSYEAALSCYRSPGYQAAKARRLGKAQVDLLIIEGVEGRH
jgi:uncharacterized protein (DUF1330 family)